MEFSLHDKQWVQRTVGSSVLSCGVKLPQLPAQSTEACLSNVCVGGCVHCMCVTVNFPKTRVHQSVQKTADVSKWALCCCVWVCVCAFVCPTSKGDRGILVQSYKWRVQQNRVHVLCDHTMVRCLYPRLVLVDCGREGRRRKKDGCTFQLGAVF